MSYCRWSSDNWKSDVYVYEHVSGVWVTHVAGNRVVGDVPRVPRPTRENKDEWLAAHRVQMEFLETAARTDIDLPYAGESFDDGTPGECADRLEALRTLGYNVPQYAIDVLRDESDRAAKAASYDTNGETE